MKKVEIYYVILYLLVIFIFEKIYNTISSSQDSHYIIEFVALFLVGLLLGFDKQLLFSKKIHFNKSRFFLAFVPIFLILSIIFCVDLIAYLNINVKYPNLILTLRNIIIYKQVGFVLLGYFLSTSFTLNIHELP
jgi:hypothetical protein